MAEFTRPSRPSKRKIFKVMKQRGKIVDPEKDRARKALLPGKRLSSKGKVYWETRKNRSDALHKDL